MSVRQLGPEDAATAQALVRAFHENDVPRAYVSRLLSDPANMLVVAELDEKVVGFVWAHWLARLAREREHLFVYEIEVARPHRRRGIGTELMQAVLSEAASKEADTFVFTNHSNTGAVSFYKRLGGRVKNGDDLLFVYP